MLKPLLFVLVLFAAKLSFSQSTDTATVFTTDPFAVAAKNGFVLPARILKLRQELSLTVPQINSLNDINKTLELKRVETAISHKRNEHTLDSIFHYKRLNEGAIIFYTNRYGLYQGEYRGALLLACYNARKLLTNVQLARLAQLQKP